EVRFLPFRDINKHAVRIRELVPSMTAGRDQGETTLAFFRLADDSLAHLGVGFAQVGQLFLDGLDAFDFKADVFYTGAVDPRAFEVAHLPRRDDQRDLAVGQVEIG